MRFGHLGCGTWEAIGGEGVLDKIQLEGTYLLSGRTYPLHVDGRNPLRTTWDAHNNP